MKKELEEKKKKQQEREKLLQELRERGESTIETQIEGGV
jgi:hypothetical protein